MRGSRRSILVAAIGLSLASGAGPAAAQRSDVEVIEPGATQLEDGEEVRFDVVVQATGDAPVALPPPVTLVQRLDGGARFDVPVEGLTVNGSTEPVTIGPGEYRSLRIRLDGIEGPGEYAAQLRFENAEPTTATLLIRWPWWTALLLLLTAIALSELLRHLWSKRLVRLRSYRSVARASDELDRVLLFAGAQPAEASVAQALRDRLAGTAQTLADAPDADVAADLDAVLERLPRLSRWITLSRAAAESGNAAAFRDRLGTAVRYIRLESDDVASATAALDSVEQALTAGPDLEAEIGALSAAVETWLSGPHSGEVTSGPAIHAAISRAKHALDTGDVEDASAALREAWRTWLEAASDDLRGLLHGHPPRLVARDTWQRLREELADQLARVRLADDPRTALDRYRAAYARYIEVAAEPLATLHDGAEPERRRRVREQAALARTRARDQRVGEAFVAFQEADAEHAKLAVRMGPERSHAVALPPPDGPAAHAQVPVTAAPTIFPPPDRITRQIRSWELVTAIAAGAILALSGLVFIYAADMSWGGWADAAALFLWGLGLYQVGNVAGLATVQAKTGTDRSGG